MHRLFRWASCIFVLGILSCLQPISLPLNPPSHPITNINQRPIIGTLEVSGHEVFVDGTPAHDGSRVYDGSRVVTYSDSSATVDLRGGGSIQLDENTDPIFTLLRRGFCILVKIGSGQIFEDTPGECIQFNTPDGSAQSDTKVNVDLRGGQTTWTVAQGEVRLSPPLNYVVRPFEQVSVLHQRLIDRRSVSPAELANITAWRHRYVFHFRRYSVPPMPSRYRPPSPSVTPPTAVSTPPTPSGSPFPPRPVPYSRHSAATIIATPTPTPTPLLRFPRFRVRPIPTPTVTPLLR
jgi:hypothetical protein